MLDIFSNLVSEIYATVLAPARWDATLADIGQAFGRSHAALVVSDGTTRALQHSAFPSGAAESYNRYYSRLDHVASAVESGAVGAVRTRAELTWSLEDSEIVTDWCRPYGFRDGLFVRLTGTPLTISLALATSQQSGPFDTAEHIALLHRLIPHLQQALRMGEHLDELHCRSADLAYASEFLRHGIIILAPRSQVLYTNPAADRILREDDGVRAQIARIESEDVRVDTRRSGGSFLWPRPSGRRPYIIHVLPLPQGAVAPIGVQRRTMIMIIDPTRDPEPPTALLRHLYGLTRSEAEIAVMVMRGQGLKPIADALSLSVTTVKTHLQHVFDKTDTHRQAELVRLLLTHDVNRYAGGDHTVTDVASRGPSARPLTRQSPGAGSTADADAS